MRGVGTPAFGHPNGFSPSHRPGRNPKLTVSRSRPERARAQLLTSLGLVAPLNKTGAVHGPTTLLRHKIAALDATGVVALVAAGEKLKTPLDRIHPGQTQLSFDHVRTKMLDLLSNAEKGLPVLEPGDLIGVAGPGQTSIVLVDGHHKLAALLALRAIFEPLGLPLLAGKTNGRPTSQLAQQITLAAKNAKVEINEDLRSLSPSAFWSALSSGQTKSAVYLRRRDGTLATHAPSKFSALTDNPYRELASAVSVKVKRTGDKRRDFSLIGDNHPIWIKDAAAPDFVEFRIGRVLEDAVKAQNLEIDPAKPVSKKMRAVLAETLAKAAEDPEHPEHAFLKDLVIVETPMPKDELKELIKVGRKRGRARWKD